MLRSFEQIASQCISEIVQSLALTPRDNQHVLRTFIWRLAHSVMDRHEDARRGGLQTRESGDNDLQLGAGFKGTRA
jgi:hypothetical protein